MDCSLRLQTNTALLALHVLIMLLSLSPPIDCSTFNGSDRDDGDSTQRGSVYRSETARMKLIEYSVCSTAYTLYFDNAQTAEFEVIEEGETAWQCSEGYIFTTSASTISFSCGEKYGLK